jgi:hypothetical protein
MSAAYTWGTTEAERRLPFPCDRYVAQAEAALFRGITVRAAPAVVFRWLCQMRVAPYSYDWIDNGGRRSPPSLTPGLEQLAVGQSMMRIFSLVEFARDRHVTLRIKHGTRAGSLFGDLAMTYLIVPEDRDALPAGIDGHADAVGTTVGRLGDDAPPAAEFQNPGGAVPLTAGGRLAFW